MNEVISINPDVLLVGNGINRCYENGVSWDGLLADMSDNYTEEQIKDMQCPAPLKAMLVTKDKAAVRLRNCSDKLSADIKPEQADMMKELLTIGFDDILTTNYSYEFEAVALNKENVSDYTLKKIMKHTDEVVKAEPRYLLHTYNAVECERVYNRIWHIHGELRKTGSMVLDHYMYINLASKMKELCNKRGNAYNRNEFTGKSWIDSFILGDVYILGFGFDLSEVDLWWLLERKKREISEHGKVVYYNIADEEDAKNNKPKLDLLNVLGAKINFLTVKNGDYRSEYEKAIFKIRQCISEKRRNSNEK